MGGKETGALARSSPRYTWVRKVGWLSFAGQRGCVCGCQDGSFYGEGRWFIIYELSLWAVNSVR